MNKVQKQAKPGWYQRDCWKCGEVLTISEDEVHHLSTESSMLGPWKVCVGVFCSSCGMPVTVEEREWR